jgi:hypothetical protein
LTKGSVQLANLLRSVREDPELPAEELARLETEVDQRVVALIKGAMERGVPGTRDLKSLKDFQPLHGLASFERYAAELAGASTPAQ